MSEEMQTAQTEVSGLRQLPLWKDWIKDNASRCVYGARFATSDLESFFDEKHGTFGFNKNMIPIFRWLRRKGMAMSEAGQMGASYLIRPVETNAATGRVMWKKAEGMMKESLVLLESTPRELLDSEQQKELERTLEKNAVKFALMNGRPDPKRLHVGE